MALGSTTYTTVTWTSGDTITEAKMDNMVANDQAYDSHKAEGYQLDDNREISWVTDGVIERDNGDIKITVAAGKHLKTYNGTDYYYMVPDGTIVMWSGTLASIPDGWYLCDGDNGTPNLLDRFVMSVPNDTTDPGTTGGAHTKTLATANLPSHSHSISSQASHTHTGTTNSGGGFEMSSSSSHTTTHYYAMGTNDYQDNTTGNNAHTHGFTTDAAGSHSHGGSTGNTGSTSSFDIRPKYYKLAFIMKA